MNGSVGNDNNHTLSPRQAQSLIEEIDNNASRCKVQLEGKANDFLKQVSTIWADENAVEFGNDIAKKTEVIIQSLAKETSSIKNHICDICNKYAQAGGKGNTVSATQLTLTSAVNPGIVKSTFDGDRYGFADSGSVQQIYDLLNELTKGFTQCGEELINSMRKTNAFGNISVKNDLIIFAGNVNSKINQEVFGLASVADKNVVEAKRRYANVSHAIGGSNFSGGTNGNGSYSNVVSAGALAGSAAGVGAAAGAAAGAVATQAGFDDDTTSVGPLRPVAQYVNDLNSLVNTLANDPALVGEAALHATTDAVKTAGGFVKSVATDPLSIVDDYKVGVGSAAQTASAVGTELASYIDKGMDVVKGK